MNLNTNDIKNIAVADQLKRRFMRFVVTKNNSYYPSVDYYETLEEANAKRDEWIESLQCKDGEYECEITVAIVIETISINTDYTSGV